MIRPLFALVSALFILPVGAMTPASAEAVQYAHRDGQLEFDLASGEYACDHGLTVGVQRFATDDTLQRIQLAWNGAHYLLERDRSFSGLPRFEDAASGLVWIDLPWKGVLLDGRTQKPLANECRAV